MKQSPFKFQGNSSKQAKKTTAAAEHEEGKGKLAPLPKDLKKGQPKVKMNTSVRTARPVSTQRPKGK